MITLGIKICTDLCDGCLHWSGEEIVRTAILECNFIDKGEPKKVKLEMPMALPFLLSERGFAPSLHGALLTLAVLRRTPCKQHLPHELCFGVGQQ